MSASTNTIPLYNLYCLNNNWFDSSDMGQLKNMRVDEEGRLRRVHCCEGCCSKKEERHERVNQTVVTSFQQLDINQFLKPAELVNIPRRIDLLEKVKRYCEKNHLLYEGLSRLFEERLKILNNTESQKVIPRISIKLDTLE